MPVAAMQGFDDGNGIPIMISTSITANPVAVSSFRVNDYGLIALVPGQGGKSTLYFVPWAQLKYASQEQPAPPVAP